MLSHEPSQQEFTARSVLRGTQGDTLLLLLSLCLLPPSHISHGSRAAPWERMGPRAVPAAAASPCRAAEGFGRNPTEHYKVRGKEKEGRGICAPTFLAANLLLSIPPACWERERECLPCFTHIWLLVVLHAPKQGPAALGGIVLQPWEHAGHH